MSSSTLAERLKKFDSQNTVSNEFRVYTVQGAVLSIVTVFLIVYFVASEAYFNFQLTLRERVHVNATNPRGLEMEFDISFPAIPCSQLSVDAQDPTGQAQSLHLDKDHHVWKHRFTMQQNGKMKVHLGDKEKLELGSTLLAPGEYTAARQLDEEDQLERKEKEEEICGSCYGAGEEDECCNSCDDVKRAYNRMGWKLSDLTVIKQCRNQGPEEQPGEGCNVHGIVALDSGGGNLHFAPAQSALKMSDQDTNIMDLLLNNFRQWNVTHTIHKLRFGPKYPAGVYQLNGETRTISDTHGMYQYYVQVIPTTYRFRNGTVLQTNQYSVTEHLRHVNMGSNRGFPGVFFVYEVTPLHVEITEEYQKGWIAFFTSVCAVVGGVVSLMGMLDQFLFSAKHKSRELAI